MKADDGTLHSLGLRLSVAENLKFLLYSKNKVAALTE
jgi:hypothetical protein